MKKTSTKTQYFYLRAQAPNQNQPLLCWMWLTTAQSDSFVCVRSRVARFEGLQLPLSNWLLKTLLNWVSSHLMLLKYAVGNHSAHWLANLPWTSLSEFMRSAKQQLAWDYNYKLSNIKLIIQSNVDKNTTCYKSYCPLASNFCRLAKQWLVHRAWLVFFLRIEIDSLFFISDSQLSPVRIILHWHIVISSFRQILSN